MILVRLAIILTPSFMNVWKAERIEKVVAKVVAKVVKMTVGAATDLHDDVLVHRQGATTIGR